MKITVVYDNETARPALQSDWGFSCHVELEDGTTLLFDTGAKGSLLFHNLQQLHISVENLSLVFISHPHWDHIGGLAQVLAVNRKCRVCIPHSCSLPAAALQVTRVKGPCEIQKNIFSTGELAGIEQSLVIRRGKGSVVLTGCSHPGLEAILEAAAAFDEPRVLLGGFHGFSRLELLDNLDLVCPCHCSQYKAEIRRLYPEKCITCGVGKVILI
ncbi:MAG: MBL fold metallo-hydrolase [Deltaproteobacteria bacterium]|nr:MBL fold metallo-hydrolase [Deltaproteobacteria bacterium]MBW2071381.1 MBL fold metallo-hydrolase [Deltaproteobacteria bacterium]